MRSRMQNQKVEYVVAPSRVSSGMRFQNNLLLISNMPCKSVFVRACLFFLFFSLFFFFFSPLPCPICFNLVLNSFSSFFLLLLFLNRLFLSRNVLENCQARRARCWVRGPGAWCGNRSGGPLIERSMADRKTTVEGRTAHDLCQITPALPRCSASHLFRVSIGAVRLGLVTQAAGLTAGPALHATDANGSTPIFHVRTICSIEAAQ